MKLSQNGKQIGIMTSDGFIKVLNERSHKAIVSEKRHRLPVTCINFIHDFNGNAEYILSGSADYTYNFIYCKTSLLKMIFGWIWTLLLLAIVLYIVSDFL